MKECTHCLEKKSFSEFSLIKLGRQSGQLRSWCKKCYTEYSREWRSAKKKEDINAYKDRQQEWNKNARPRVMAWHRQKYYGITQEEWDALGPFCQLCGSINRLAVDHNHNTGQVRGKLCFDCNTALGKFKDNPAVLRRAAAYLEG